MLEAVLLHVIAKPGDKRRVDLVEIGERLLDARWPGAVLDHEEVIRKLLGAAQHPAIRIQGEARAVEDQLVLPADEVHERKGRAALARTADEHRLARAPLAAQVGRAGRVHDQLRAHLGLGRRRRPGLPGVLADGEAHTRAGDLDDDGVGPRLEVAPLVEDGVVRQALLAIDRLDLAVAKQGQRVVGVPGPRRIAVGRYVARLPRLGKAHQGGDPFDL